jgi:hypothetical protein
MPYKENPWGYFDRPGEHEQEEIDQSRKTLANIVLKKPLPEGLHMEHTVDQGRYGGALHKIVITDLNRADKSNPEVGVGNLRWDGTNGHVSGFYVDDDHLNAVPHMLEAAHAISGAYGHVGPNHSEDMSKYSYKLAQRYAPTSIPYHATVEDIPREDYDDPRYGAHQALGQSITNLENKTYALTDKLARWASGGEPYEHARNAHDALSNAVYVHNDRDYSGVASYLEDVKEHLKNASASIVPTSPLDRANLHKDHVDSLHDEVTSVMNQHKDLLG